MDGLVDVADYNIWSANVGKTNQAWSQGDLNEDGLVDVADYNIWAANVGKVVPWFMGPSGTYTKLVGPPPNPATAAFATWCNDLLAEQGGAGRPAGGHLLFFRFGRRRCRQRLPGHPWQSTTMANIMYQCGGGTPATLLGVFGNTIVVGGTSRPRSRQARLCTWPTAQTRLTAAFTRSCPTATPPWPA